MVGEDRVIMRVKELRRAPMRARSFSVATIPAFVACTPPSVRTLVIIDVPFPSLPVGVMGLKSPGKVRHLFTHVSHLPTLSPISQTHTYRPARIRGGS